MRFSIIIPAYNSAKYIVKALESVRAQSFTDYELIVVCDSCKDNTADKARNALMMIQELERDGALIIDNTETNNCLVQQSVLEQVLNKRKYEIIGIVTCNRKMAHDILMMNHLKSCTGYEVYCFDLSNGGALYYYDEKNINNSQSVAYCDIMQLLTSRKGA